MGDASVPWQVTRERSEQHLHVVSLVMPVLQTTRLGASRNLIQSNLVRSARCYDKL